MEREYIASFLANLDLALHDQVLETEGQMPEFYWDTSDVRNALLGQAAYYDYDETGKGQRVERFNRGRFQNDRALVHCLEGAGWFGPLRMLQPHQAELYKLVSREFEIGSVGPPEGGATQFVKDVQLEGLQQIEFAKLADLPPEGIAAVVRKQAGSAPTLFKVVQCVRPYGWKARLARWARSKLIEVDGEPYDYRSLLSTKTFELLLAEFDKERPKFGANNFADAVALCQLAQRTRDYEAGKARIPRFFSRRLDIKILDRTQLVEQFTYTHGERRYSVFRDTEYYKLRATLNPPNYGRPTEADTKSLPSLRETRERLAEIRKAQEPLTEELLDTVTLAGRPLTDVLRGLREYLFLEQVWLPFAAHTEVMDAIKEYIEPARELERSPEAREEIEAQVGKTMVELSDKSSQYQRLSHFWTELGRSVSRVIPDNVRDLNLFKTSGLLRFGFPVDSQQAMADTLGRLVDPQGSSRNRVLVEFFRRCQAPTDGTVNLALAAGVLWALRMDAQIADLLSNVDALRHYSLKAVAAAACFRRRTDLLKGWELTQQLEGEYLQASATREKFDLAVALGYLYFHYWQCMTSGRVHLGERDRRALLEQAVQYARKAADMKSGDLEKRVYAVNQCLYYALHGSDVSAAAEVNASAEELLTFDGNQEVWQYRYDDTLAYYFERRATQTEAGQKQRWLELAMRRMDKAWEGANGDEEVAVHREKLMVRSAT